MVNQEPSSSSSSSPDDSLRQPLLDTPERTRTDAEDSRDDHHIDNSTSLPPALPGDNDDIHNASASPSSSSPVQPSAHTSQLLNYYHLVSAATAAQSLFSTSVLPGGDSRDSDNDEYVHDTAYTNHVHHNRRYHRTAASNNLFHHFLRRRQQEQLQQQQDESDHYPHPTGTTWPTPAWWYHPNTGLKRFPLLWLTLMVTLLWPYGIHSFHVFHDHTDSTFHPIPGSPSAAAQRAFQRAYSDDNTQDTQHNNNIDWFNPMHPPIVLVLQSTLQANQSSSTNTASLVDPNSPAYAVVQEFCNNLVPTLEQYCWNDNHNNFNPWNKGHNCTTTTTTTTPWLKTISYYSLVQEGLPQMASTLSLVNGTTTMVQLLYTLSDDVDEKQRIFVLLDALENYISTHGNATIFSVQLTGLHLFQRDLVESTKTDMTRMDTFAVPFAFVLMGIVLRRKQANPWILWIVPLMTLITTCCTWSIVMRFVVQVIQITQFTPTVMLSLSLGMGIDYTLFLLARYVELYPHPDAIYHMLLQGGHVVLVSGVTLLGTFLGLCALPLPMLSSLGVGAAVAIVSAMASNLVVVPLLLHTPLGEWIIAKDKRRRQLSDHQHPAEHTHLRFSYDPIPNDAVLREMRNNPELPWIRITNQLMHPWKGSLILVLVCSGLAVVSWQAQRLDSSIAFDLLLPSNSPSLQTFRRLSNEVGPGRLLPYRILFDGNEVDKRMNSVEGFGLMNTVVEELRRLDDPESYSLPMTPMPVLGELTETRNLISRNNNSRTHSTGTKYTGISMLDNHPVSHTTYAAARLCDRAMTTCPVEMFRLINAIDHSATSYNEKATFITATLDVDPSSEAGIHWLREARAIVQHLTTSGTLQGVGVHIQGVPSVEEDAVDAVYASFPTMVTITVVVVLTFTGIFFRSALSPLRSCVSTFFTVTFSFGLAVLVFQDGILNFTGIACLESLESDFCWLVPIMAFSVMVGLALDYDAFLMSRILEFRLDGCDHRESISAGLYATSGVISSAGIIMAVAFGSLMLSSSPVLYQWSFLLTTAVLLDTFVVRTVIVPVITNLLGEMFWWPRELPEPIYSLSTIDNAAASPPFEEESGNDQISNDN